MGLKLLKSPKNPLSDARFEMDTRELKGRSVRSGAITVAAQAMTTLIQMVSVIVLARILTPDDYGTITMVTAVTGFIDLFRELGLSSATIRTRGITHDQVSNLFWINTGLGAAITLVIAASGPVMAWFYHKPQLIPIAASLSLTSVLSSLGTQHRALINRDMRFASLAVIRVSALLAGFLAALAVALAGGTYWALVANNLVIAVWSTAGVWKASGFRPGRFKKKIGLRPLLHFGANVAGADILTYFQRNTDNVLIGRAWGAGELGLYNKAYSLLMLPITNLRYPLNTVAYPALSRLQDEPAAFRAFFSKYCALLAFVTMPIVAFLFASSAHVIRLFLGPRWIGASELFSILAVVSFIQAPAGLKTTVQTAMGRGRRLFRLSFISTAAAITAFAIGLRWGAKGVAIGYGVSTYLILHPTLVYAFRDTPVRPADFYRSVLKPAVAAIAMGATLVLAEGRLKALSDAPLLALMFCLGAAIYFGIFVLLPGGRKALTDYWEYLTILWTSTVGAFSKLRRGWRTEGPAASGDAIDLAGGAALTFGDEPGSGAADPEDDTAG
jgi:O-antigen/teichoic acid export membrane protein